MPKRFRDFLNASDRYVLSHIYALENNTVNALFAEYQRAYHNMAIALESVQKRYGVGETWSATDAQYRQRTESLIQQVIAEMRNLSNRTSDITIKAAMQSYYAGYYGKAWQTEMLTGSTLRVPLLPTEAIRAAILKPYEGSTFVDRFIGKDDDFQSRIRKSIVQSQINGETMYQAQKRIAAELGIDISRRRKVDKMAHSRDFNRTQMIARTEIIKTSNMGAMALYEENKDVLSGWEWKASNDERTCPICGDLDGKKFTFEDEHDHPPAHPNCRCTALPWIKSESVNRLVKNVSYKDWAAGRGVDGSLTGPTFDLPGARPPRLI